MDTESNNLSRHKPLLGLRLLMYTTLHFTGLTVSSAGRASINGASPVDLDTAW
jgi:hypothetical protein